MKTSRGDIYYIEANNSTGCEMGGRRPGIIVSNDVGNIHSSVVEVVYLTTAPKKPLPTHVLIHSSRVPSTAICEQVSSVSKERIREQVGKLTDFEMRQIDIALAISLGICLETSGSNEAVNIETLEARIERNVYKQLYLELLHSREEVEIGC